MIMISLVPCYHHYRCRTIANVAAPDSARGGAGLIVWAHCLPAAESQECLGHSGDRAEGPEMVQSGSRNPETSSSLRVTMVIHVLLGMEVTPCARCQNCN